MFRNLTLQAIAVALVIALAPTGLSAIPAMAAEAVIVAPAVPSATAVILPFGDWIVAIANTITSVLVPTLVAGVGYVLTRFAGPLRMIITDKLIEDTIKKWLAFGIQQVEGATKDKTFTFDVGSAVVAETLNRATSRAAVNDISAWVMKAAGGEAEIAKKITRMIPLDEHAVASAVAAKGLAESTSVKVI